MSLNSSHEADPWPAVVGVFVFAVALWAQTGAMAGVFYDDGIYLVLAKSLAEGSGYRYLNLPGAPEAVHYPPLYPFLLSLLWRIWPEFPANLALFKVFDSACLSGAALLVTRHSRRLDIPTAVRLPSLLIAFTAFPLLAIVAMRFSEPLFLLLFTAALVTIDRDQPGPRHVVAAATLAGLATLTRSIGVALVVGTVAVLLMKRRFGAASAFGVVVLAFLVPWQLWMATHAGGIDNRLLSVYGSYGNLMAAVGPGGFIKQLSPGFFGPVPRLLLPGVPSVLWWPLALCLAAVTLSGAISLYTRSRLLVITLGAYLAVLAVWPYLPDRFIWVILPWWMLAIAAGLIRLFRWRPAGAVLTVIGLGVLLSGYGPREVSSLTGHSFTATAERIAAPFTLLAPTVRQELPVDAVIASGDEALVFLYTARHSVPASLVDVNGSEFEDLSVAASFDFYCENGVTHVFDSGPGDRSGAIIDSLTTMTPPRAVTLFAVTDGPRLAEVSCDS